MEYYESDPEGSHGSMCFPVMDPFSWGNSI